jgi:hypothetical protein
MFDRFRQRPRRDPLQSTDRLSIGSGGETDSASVREQDFSGSAERVSCGRDEGRKQKERSLTPLRLCLCDLGETYPIGVLETLAPAPEVSTRITPD